MILALGFVNFCRLSDDGLELKTFIYNGHGSCVSHGVIFKVSETLLLNYLELTSGLN